MARFLKIIALIIGIFIVLVVIAGIVLPMIIDINEHKDRISLEIEKATGYEVTIEGDIELSLIPWIGLSLGRTHVANPPEFDDAPMASLEELQIRIKFWPLLSRRIEADNIVLNGFELALIKDEQGRENWVIAEDPDARVPEEPEEPPVEREEPSPEVSPVIADLNIEGLRISNAFISYEDRQTNQAVYIRNLNLETGNIIMDSPFDFSADMNIESVDPEVRGNIEISALTTIDSQNEIIRLDNFLLNIIDVRGEILAVPVQNDQIRADIVYELPNNALYVNNLDINIHEAQLFGELSALNLDGTPDISFEITGRNIDLDQLLGETSNNGNQAESPRKTPAAPTGSNSSPGEPINLSFLTDYHLNGQIDLEEIRTANILLDSLSAAISSGHGRMTISPITARLYGGIQQSDITLEDREGVLHISAVQSLEDLQIGPFVQDLAEQDIITGTARIHSNIETWGQDNDAFTRNMSGDAELSLSDGVIRGIDLERMIREVFALAAGEIGSITENGGETGFTRMEASFDIDNGIAVSRDLSMNSPVLSLEGEMTADLPRSHLESSSRISLDGALREELVTRYNFRDVSIPLRVSGPFDDLRFGLDSDTLIRSLIQERGEEELRKLMDRLLPSDNNGQNDDPSNDVEGLLRKMIPGR